MPMAYLLSKKVKTNQWRYLLLRLATRVGAAFALRDFFESFHTKRAYQSKNKPMRVATTNKIITKRFADEFDAAGFATKV